VCLRFSTLLFNIRPQNAGQITSVRDFVQLDGLAIAISWGFESPLPHQKRERPGAIRAFFHFAALPLCGAVRGNRSLVVDGPV